MKTHTSLDIQEPIVALSSAAGPGARAVVRLSGTGVWNLAQSCFTGQDLPASARRGRWAGSILLSELPARLPAELLAWAEPRSYTGQDLVEIHLLSSPPIVEALIAHLLQNGARTARPGEFTLRAFLAGKLDLTQAEGVLGVIEAEDADELKTALGQLAGNVARPLHVLRDQLLNLLAEVEAGLDFTEEDLHFISQAELVCRLENVHSELQSLYGQLQDRSLAGRWFRAVLAGPPNAGKSSLFNALAGGAHALVSAEPGTTRDYLVQRLEIDGVPIELVDTAGHEDVSGPFEGIREQSQQGRAEQAAAADLLVFCHDASNEAEVEPRTSDARLLHVWTKCDLPHGPLVAHDTTASWPRTSAVTNQGIVELRALLVEHARAARRPVAPSPLAPSWSRCRHHLEAARTHVEQAAQLGKLIEPPELLALELRLAVEQLGEMVGAVYTDDLLDRIFSQFCIGK